MIISSNGITRSHYPDTCFQTLNTQHGWPGLNTEHVSCIETTRRIYPFVSSPSSSENVVEFENSKNQNFPKTRRPILEQKKKKKKTKDIRQKEFTSPSSKDDTP